MGKKRNRSTANAKPANVGIEGAPTHSQSLVDDVRETRDIEFAAEKRQQLRAKRRKINDEVELAAVKKAAKALQKANKGSENRMDARKAGLEMWRKAALRRKMRAKREEEEGYRGTDEDDEDDAVIDPKTTAKIFKEAREQRTEIREENLNAVANEAAKNNAKLDNDLHGVGERKNANENEFDDSEDDSEGGLGGAESDVVTDEADLDFLDGSKITEEDEMALAMFSNMEGKAKKQDESVSSRAEVEEAGLPRMMLADIILAKIREKEEADARAVAIAADPEKAARDRKIAEVYGLVGNIMSKYRSGKVPKAFKVISKLRNWEDILYLTRPDEWSPAAVFVATRLLASNLPAKEVVRFYTDILLPRCLEDISEHKKLNYHLYRALGKAVYKPDAFVKGILFPLCEDSNCTLRQATIIGSIVSKVSIPMLHSAAALLYIVQLPFRPSNSIIITTLLQKKYALPYRVLDAVVESFLRMKDDARSPPLLWHQSLLCFAQRYKMELTMEQKEGLKVLMREHTHHGVTPEIRRELFSARSRGDLMEPDADTIARNIASAAMIV